MFLLRCGSDGDWSSEREETVLDLEKVPIVDYGATEYSGYTIAERCEEVFQHLAAAL